MQIEIKTSFNSKDPSDEVKEVKEEEDKLTLRGLFRFATTADKALIGVGTVFSILMGAALPTFAHLMGNMIDSFAVGIDRYEESKKNLLNFIYLGLAAFASGALMYSTWGISGQRQATLCRKKYFSSLIRQQMGWFDTQKQAQIASSFSLDALSFQQAIGERISTVIMLISMVLTGIGIALYNGWILTLVVMAYLPFLILAWTYNIVTKHKVFKDRNQIFSESDIKAQESLEAIKLVKQMNAQTFQEDVQEGIMEKIGKKYGDTAKTYAFANTIAGFVLHVGFNLTFWYGSQCVFDNGPCPQSISRAPYTGGTIIKIFYALFLPAISLNQLAPSLQKVVEGMSAATRIFKIIDKVPEIRSKENALIPTAYFGIFEFVDVTFGYPKDKKTKIMKGFNMKIDSMHSGIVGKSGSGKSTIFQLLMRFYDPDEGAIFLDGNNIRDLDLDWLRSQIGYVGQQPVLFATSIRENLLLARPEASNEKIHQALAKAEALSFVNKLPDKLDTFVGSGGSQLSGGQKQRIAIARALLKKPKLLLLDEATSALDRTNEQEILATIAKMEKEFQSISITHRKRVLNTCDKVYRFTQTGVKVVSKSRQRSSINIPSASEYNIDSSLLITSTKHFEIVHAQENKSLALKSSNKQKKKEEKEVQSSSKLSKILPFLLQNKCYVGVCLLFCLLDGISFPITGVLIAQIMVNLLQYPLDHQHFSSQTYKYIIGVAVMTFIAPLTNTMAVSLGSLTGQKVVKEIRTSIFAKLLRLPVSWFQKQENQHEKVINKLTSSCKTLHSFLSLESPTLLILVVNVIAGVAGGIYFEWRTGLTSIGLIPLIILSQTIQLGFIQGFAEKKGKIYESSSQIINESILNIRTVLALGGLQPFEQRYADKIDEIYEQVSFKCFVSGLMYGISNFLQYLTFGLVLFLATVFVVNYEVGIDKSLSSVFLIFFACISAGNKVNLIQDLQHLKQGSRWIFSMLELKDEHELLKEEGRKQLTNPIRGNIEFKDVSFKYENREGTVLDGLSLKFKEGEEVTLVGSSGCGKSTVISLLLGFYSPSNGQILLEGIDIRDYDLKHLRDTFGVVSQQPILFNEAIDWNIRYNKQSISDGEDQKAAKQANFNPNQQKFSEINEYIIRQPADRDKKVQSSANLIVQDQEQKRDGFKKIVGPKGSHVSGGQKQRIAIARAILRQPTVLLLDEATSALDPENEAKVQDSLDRLMREKTTINITHRLQNINPNKKVYVIVDGKVAEEGTCSELVAGKGLFSRMCMGNQQMP